MRIARAPLLRALSARLPLAALALVGCGLASGLAGCDDEPAASGPPPLTGSRPELERWVVHLKGAPPDPTPYREALAKGPEEARAAAEQLRQAAINSRAPFAQRIADLGGRIVDHWWLTNAVTVELPGGNVPTLKVLDEVERIEPDQLLVE